MPPMPTLAPVRKPPMSPFGAFTNTVSQPVPPTPLQAPNLPPSPQAPGFTFTSPTVGAAPTPSPYGTFQAPDPSQLANNPAFQFRLEQANKGANRSAAAHGTLLSGGLQAALAKLNQGLASEEYDKIYGRALTDYNTNRDTNAQNFGQQMGSFTAGANATLDAGRLNLAGETAGYDRRYGALRDTYGDERDAAQTQAGVNNANQHEQALYQQHANEYQAYLDAQRAEENRRRNEEAARMTGTRPVYPSRQMATLR